MASSLPGSKLPSVMAADQAALALSHQNVSDKVMILEVRKLTGLGLISVPHCFPLNLSDFSAAPKRQPVNPTNAVDQWEEKGRNTVCDVSEWR